MLQSGFCSASSMLRLQVLFCRCNNTASEDRAPNLHIDLVERAHDCLDPVLVNFGEEQSDCLFGLWRRGIRRNGCRSSRGHGANWLGWCMEEKELHVFDLLAYAWA